ncbi:hypothetical protein CO057_02915 [Candidatus Uhrbacteria bacterium CG_4_9_14_0_2_um_filter_41_50]|uniref:Uncharacterized protein n=1 Tax=Candidatus Uhrbacteria bacterium CG_4_9_14_0_2_um_filter_41_50 TaxID=1975031 RepID=A0A2M8EP31_9BACT|nr:MAG: hypothetical protein CO057_02915 [Candidatus Uhrbacteria bacterium CG_4_9_14_0_2_um_filter_41_50]
MNYIRKHILSLLHDYSNTEKQRYEWVDNLQKTHFTPTELIEEWFSDTFTNIPEDLVKKGEITQEEWEIIRPFYYLFRIFADHFWKYEDNIPANMTEYEPWKLIIESSEKTKQKLEKLGWKLDD